MWVLVREKHSWLLSNAHKLAGGALYPPCLSISRLMGSSLSSLPQMEAEAVNGPTTEQGDLPPFDWHQFSDMEHRGQPRRFAFQFERMSAAAVQEQTAGLRTGRHGCPSAPSAAASLQAQ